MTDPGDGLKALLQIEDNTINNNIFLKAIFSSVEILSGFGAAIQAVGAIAGLFSDAADLATVVDTIKTDFSAVFAAQSAEDTIRLMVQVGSLLDEARSYRDFARSAKPTDPGWASEAGAAVDNVHARLLKLLDPSGYMWLRLYFPSDNYAPDPYTKNLNLSPPQPIQGAAFDFRLTLPATLEMITIWLLILATVLPDWINERGGQIADLGQALSVYYEKIKAGITDIENPKFGVNPFDHGNGNIILVQYTNWTVARPYGAVQIYGGEGLVGRYPDVRWPTEAAVLQDRNKQVLQREIYEFMARSTIGTYIRHVQLYNANGLAHVYKIMNLLLAYDNRPTLTADARAGDISLRKVWSIAKNFNWTTGNPQGRVGIRANLITALAGAGSGFIPQVRKVLMAQ